MTTLFEQDIDEQLREMFAIHKDYFDQKEREVEGRRKINLLSSKPNPFEGYTKLKATSTISWGVAQK